MSLRLPYYITIIIISFSTVALAQSTDSTKSKIPRFYNWTDTYLNKFNYRLSPALTLDPNQVSTRVLFNPNFQNFSITEKVNESIDLKTPESLSFNDYSSIQNAMIRRAIIRDIERAQDGYTDFSGKRIKPLLEVNKIFDRLFGDKLPEFKPNGYIQIMAAHHRRRTDNPTNIYNMDRSYFEFDQQIAINFNNFFNNSTGGGQFPNTGQFPRNGQFPRGRNNFPNSPNFPNLPNAPNLPNIDNPFDDFRLQDIRNVMPNNGSVKEKVNILGNLDTKSAFTFDNRFKIDFKNDPEDILQSVELGNISFPNRSQLIPGVQNLLGAQVGLRFGRLNLIGAVAQQNSKTKSITLSNGSQNKGFEIRADNYEENRHFFLSHFFRNNYEKSLQSLPVVTSGVIITRVEAYVTNRTYSVETNRNIIGLNDLGEVNPYSSSVKVNGASRLGIANNTVNSLNDDVIRNGNRDIDQIGNSVNALGLRMGQDYEILRGAKKLMDSEFDLNEQLGYISLRTPLRNDEVLAVSFEYTYRGERYRVGELTEDYVNRDESQALVLKLLKSSNIRNNLKNPMWDLMMKNVYSLAQGQLKQEGFQLRVIYKDDKTGMDVPFLSDIPDLKNIPLLGLLSLDRLNYNNEIIGDGKRGGDGNFDFIEGVTVNQRYGRIIFPVLEPFGSHLENVLSDQDKVFRDKYVFNDLYEKTQTDAIQNTLKNKFFLTGSLNLGGSDITLPMGVTMNSVRVYSGGTQLKQGTDYMIDPQMGTIRMMNQALTSSGRPIRIEYEEQDMFQTQIRRFFGLRADYTVSRNLRIGATLQDLRENTPGFTTRTSIGNEPVNNTLWGLDLNYKKTGTGLTKLLDQLPGVQTKEPSAVLLTAEFAQLIPGVNTKRVNNSSMIDDFEYARNINDLSRQPNRWRLGSTPPQFQSENGSFENPIFTKSYEHHFRRAKMSVYSIDMTTYFSGQAGAGIIPPELGEEARKNPFTANFNIQDILVGRSMPTFAEQVPTSILDIAYFPSEPGMYNYNTQLNTKGFLANDPKKNFGSVMRGITFDADFDNSNVEYLEFWMLNPFEGEIPLTDKVTNTTGGKILIQLGDVSEDVIPDSRFNFENGIRPDSLGGNASARPYIHTAWGKAPDTQFMVDAFENDPTIRKIQDVGFDGLSNEDERNYVNPNNPSEGGIKGYLDKVRGIVTDPDAFARIYEDPSKDDFKHFLDPSFNQGTTFLERYKHYLGVENNSPFNHEGAKATVVYSNSNLIDKEDVNQDNTINELEDFFEYELDIKADASRKIASNKYVVDQVDVAATAERPATTWYLFRVPVKDISRKFPVDKDDNFKSIRFMRLVTTEWEQPVVLRFATMQLVSNQYRKYQYKINDNTSENFEKPLDEQEAITTLNTTTVSIEENGCPKGQEGCSKDYPYAVPPGFVRDINFAHQARMEFNEQSMSLSVKRLRAKDSRAVFKNTQLDLNMYKRIKMFVHMHTEELSSDSLGMFLRIGTDLKNNYYEIEIPQLTRTEKNQFSPNLIWPEQNEIDVPLELIRSLKLRRNQQANTENFIYQYTEEVSVEGTVSGSEAPTKRTYKISVKGNPDLSRIMTIMIGVRNNGSREANYDIWTDELRAFGFDGQDKGSAGLLNADIKLADLGTLLINGNFRNFGFGSVQDRISGRSREDAHAFSGALNLALDKFLPMTWGLKIPFFVNYDRQVAVPGFNPLDQDIRLNQALEPGNLSPYHTYLTKNLASNISTTSGFNFMNVHKVRGANSTKNNFYDIENFTFSYAQNRIYRSNILMAKNDQSMTSAGLTYQFNPKGINFEPFANKSGLDSSFFKFLKPLNINPIPNVIAFKVFNEQVFYRSVYRGIDLRPLEDENLIKYFYGNRHYDLQWNLTKSITVTYNAHMLAILDDVKGYTTAQEDVKFGSRLFSLGRAKNYNQKMRVTWRLPLDLIYPLDWITANTTYDNRFSFKGVAFNQIDTASYNYFNGTNQNDYAFGNLLENGREFGVDGRVDFMKLYEKFAFFRRANRPDISKQRFTRTPGYDRNMPSPNSNIAKTLTRLLMTARSINGRFALTESTVLPGFLETPQFFGLSSSGAPGLPFVLGSQKTSIIDRAASEGWLSRSIQQYNPVIQRQGMKFEYSTNLEPFKGLRMVIRGNLERNNDISYVFQPNEENMFEKFSPVRGGSFKMSFWSFKTSFKKVDAAPSSGYLYEPYTDLVANRDKVLDILTEKNLPNFTDEDGNLRLDKNSQDVLIPAFFAAYTGRDVNDLFTKKKFTRKNSNTFNPFLGFPMPNWQINYQGLEKVPLFRTMFSSITLSHQFTSSYSVGNFTSSLSYRDMAMLDFRGEFGKGYTLGDRENVLNNLFDPVYVMSSIVMEEKFGPFLGINFTTKGNFTGNFAWNKDRMAMLNLSNAQVSERHGNDFVFGFGIKKNNIVLPIRGADGNSIVLKNDLTFRMDFSWRDLKLIQRKLDGDAIIKNGARSLQVRPNVQYTFSRRVSMTMYWEKQINTPYVSQTWYTNNASFGVTARFNISD